MVHLPMLASQNCPQQLYTNTRGISQTFDIRPSLTLFYQGHPVVLCPCLALSSVASHTTEWLLMALMKVDTQRFKKSPPQTQTKYD